VKATVKLESTDEPPVAKAEPAETIDNSQTTEARDENKTRPAMETPSEAPPPRAAPVTAGEDGKPVLRAIRVNPHAEKTPVEIRRAVPVGPMDEVEEGSLLKAATPSPAQPDNQ
jgi:hypothetical protein